MNWHIADVSGRYTGWAAHLIIIFVITFVALAIGWAIRAICAKMGGGR